MKKQMLVSVFIMCFFCLLIPNVVFGLTQIHPVELAQQVYDNANNKYNKLLLREDIRLLLPKILITFRDSPRQDAMNKAYFIHILDNPSILAEIDQNVDGKFIGLLSTDIELYKFLADEKFFNVLKNDEAINELIELIKDAQTEPKKLEIVSGNFQQGNLNTPHEPFIVVVTDLYKDLYKEESPYNEIYPNRPGLIGEKVIFKIIKGKGTLSGEITHDDGIKEETTGLEVESTTNEKGQAQATLIPGPNEGLIRVEARVEVKDPSPEEEMSLKKIFIVAVFTLDRPEPPVVNITPSEIVFPNSKKFTLNVNIKGGESIRGYVIIVKYDPTVLTYLKLIDDNGNPTFNGEYLSGDLDLRDEILENESENQSRVVLLASFPSSSDSLESGDGVLARLTFEGIGEFGKSTVELDQVQLLKSGNSGSSPFIPNFGNDQVIVLGYNAVDVDGNGGVNVQDFMLVVQSFGKTGEGLAEDVNGDGVVNIHDLIFVNAAIGETSSAPAAPALAQAGISATDVQTWLTQAKASNPNIPESIRTHPDYQRGITVLENLLSTLTQTAAPKKTALLLNYPNPFNPETWIPYQLAEATDVTVTIHSLNGTLIRTLSLGHKTAGLYRSKSRAAYWDGKNEFGERVASGFYFYTLTAGKFSATGKMLIRK